MAVVVDLQYGADVRTVHRSDAVVLHIPGIARLSSPERVQKQLEMVLPHEFSGELELSVRTDDAAHQLVCLNTLVRTLKALDAAPARLRLPNAVLMGQFVMSLVGTNVGMPRALEFALDDVSTPFALHQLVEWVRYTPLSETRPRPTIVLRATRATQREHIMAAHRELDMTRFSLHIVFEPRAKCHTLLINCLADELGAALVVTLEHVATASRVFWNTLGACRCAHTLTLRRCLREARYTADAARIGAAIWSMPRLRSLRIVGAHVHVMQQILHAATLLHPRDRHIESLELECVDTRNELEAYIGEFIVGAMQHLQVLSLHGIMIADAPRFVAALGPVCACVTIVYRPLDGHTVIEPGTNDLASRTAHALSLALKSPFIAFNSPHLE